MKTLIEMLVKRDGMSREEAKELIRETRAEMYEALESGDYCEAEEIFCGNLGLEPDYLIYIF